MSSFAAASIRSVNERRVPENGALVVATLPPIANGEPIRYGHSAESCTPASPARLLQRLSITTFGRVAYETRYPVPRAPAAGIRARRGSLGMRRCVYDLRAGLHRLRRCLPL